MQNTLNKPVSAEGTGLHTDAFCRVTLFPAPPDHGICFKIQSPKSKIQNPVVIPARVSHVWRNAENCTVLHDGKHTKIYTVEHLLSALYGSGIHNVRIEIQGPEVPALDGSALPWVSLLKKAGKKKQNKKTHVMALKRSFVAGAYPRMILAFPSETLQITYILSHSHPLIGSQMATCKWNETRYQKEIAPARTFATVSEAKALRAKGLAKGGSEENAVVIFKRAFSSKPRMPEEFSRHKILDILGDLCLTGMPLKAHIIGFRSGHKLNFELIKKLENWHNNVKNRGYVF